MSHITRVETEIHDREILVNTLKELGYSLQENRWVGNSGESLLMDIAVMRGGGSWMGFRRIEPDHPFTIYAPGTRSGELRAFHDKVLQRYAKNKILKEARRRNYALVRERSFHDGRIQLTLRKIA